MVKCHFLVKTQIKSIEKMLFSTPFVEKTISPNFFKKWFFKIQSGGELCMNFSYNINLRRREKFSREKFSPFHSLIIQMGQKYIFYHTKRLQEAITIQIYKSNYPSIQMQLKPYLVG